MLFQVEFSDLTHASLASANTTQTVGQYRPEADRPCAKSNAARYDAGGVADLGPCVMMVEDAPKSRCAVWDTSPHFAVFKEFKGAS